jgi:Fur family ferric uptake transcriptional regulator
MESKDNVLVRSILTDKGYSWTKPRRLVFEILAGGGPLTIVDIANKVSDRIDRVSVYRTIDLFEKLGIIHRVNVGWKYKLELSDQFVSHHHHLSCTSCGRVIDIEDEKHIDSFISQVAERFEFQPKHHQFEIEGLCRQCQAKQLPA